MDVSLDDGQVLRLGDADWEVARTLGHTPGHLALWQPDERLLVVGDALSDYDVGWVNLALDGPEAAATALASLKRMADLDPRVILPSHGPVPVDPGAAFAGALRRAQRLVDDPGAVWYGARRIFAFALMIRGGIPAGEVEPYLHARQWLADAARVRVMVPRMSPAAAPPTHTAPPPRPLDQHGERARRLQRPRGGHQSPRVPAPAPGGRRGRV